MEVHISVELLKELREKTGAGIADIKKALVESLGDSAKAEEIILRKLGSSAAKKAGRETSAGLIDAYIHSNGRIGVLVELYCETDFVARNPSFKEFAHDVAMHIAAMRPVYLSLDLIPRDAWDAEKKRFEEEVRPMQKPAHILSEIVDGKLKSHFGAFTLLSQPFVKDQDKTVGDALNEVVGKFGENIKIGNFTRIEL